MKIKNLKSLIKLKNNMKRLIIFFTAIIALVCFNGCENENVAKLKREIEAVDKQCPINLGIMGDMLSLKYDEKAKEVLMYFSLNEDAISIEALMGNEQMALKSMKLSFSRDESKETLEQMINAGASLSITYKSASTGKSFKVSLTLDELKEIQNNPMSEMEVNQMLLENSMAMENARCPYLVDQGMEMVKVIDDGNNIVYNVRLDEDMYDMSLFEYAQDEIKQNMKEIFNDPIIKQELGMIHAVGKGFVYNYYGDTSGKSVKISFSNYELSIYIQE